MHAAVLSATENRFAVVDAFRDPPPVDPEETARRLCGGATRALDGLLLLTPPRHGGDCRMVLYNPDGSRPEACGNGLRCIAKLAVENGHVNGDCFIVETDGGLRGVVVTREGKSVRRAATEMGVPRVIERNVSLATTRGAVTADLIDMGNPHCVLFVDDVEEAPVAELGAELERHGRFPQRTNVEFACVTESGLTVRIWERGVGETASCGSGVSAATAAAILRGDVRSPVLVQTPGGQLRVEWNGRGILRLDGPVSDIEDRIRLAEGD